MRLYLVLTEWYQFKAIMTMLEDRNANITSQFVRVFKIFEDFRFISQLREEMDKVRPAVIIAG